LYTGRPPFSDNSDVAVILKIISGERPERPANMPEILWNCVTEYWDEKFAIRPLIEMVVNDMTLIRSVEQLEARKALRNAGSFPGSPFRCSG
jgi:hypothetical protein